MSAVRCSLFPSSPSVILSFSVSSPLVFHHLSPLTHHFFSLRLSISVSIPLSLFPFLFISISLSLSLSSSFSFTRSLSLPLSLTLFLSLSLSLSLSSLSGRLIRTGSSADARDGALRPGRYYSMHVLAYRRTTYMSAPSARHYRLLVRGASAAEPAAPPAVTILPPSRPLLQR